MILTRYTDGRLTASICADDLAAFASSWPCFGTVEDASTVTADWAPNGDLEALDGDDGFDERGILALLADVQEFGFACVRKGRCRRALSATIEDATRYLENCDALGIERVPATAF